jgi:hypothetical protein
VKSRKPRGRPAKGPGIPINLAELTTHEGIVGVLARVLERFLADRLSEVKARSTITALRLALDVLKDKRELDIESRLGAMEEALANIKERGGKFWQTH